MENDAKQTETFRHYAESRLDIHQQELATRYYDRKLASAELEAEALAVQREIFKKELIEKIEELSKGGDQSAQPSLEAMKDDYVKKLTFPESLK
ncbi:hypothetical protein [Persicitalea sp.]|uniref:hypothetical protein n=1 Tax=Persicitalea sp. TaxID=3100273 RepID=UPI0035940D82